MLVLCLEVRLLEAERRMLDLERSPDDGVGEDAEEARDTKDDTGLDIRAEPAICLRATEAGRGVSLLICVCRFLNFLTPPTTAVLSPLLLRPAVLLI